MRLDERFYLRDVLEVAPGLVGKKIVRMINGSRKEFIITEVEAYRGTEDLACHASKGRTSRTEIMFKEGGKLYIYLIYGMYYMLNVVTGPDGSPQAVLIRGVSEIAGPGRLSRELGIDKSFYGESLTESQRIWIEYAGKQPILTATPRIGIDYSGEYWKRKLWRWKMK